MKLKYNEFTLIKFRVHFGVQNMRYLYMNKLTIYFYYLSHIFFIFFFFYETRIWSFHCTISLTENLFKNKLEQKDYHSFS